MDVDLNAPSTYLPFPKNRRFTGRTDELHALECKLLVEQDRAKVAIAGLGGIGKTQVALSFAYSVKEKHPEFSVFWVPALSVESFEQAYGEIASMLGIRSASNEEEDVKEVVRRHLSATSAGRWLLIVDNADDMDMLEESETAADLLEYLPESDLGLTIFTTRSYEVAQSLVGSDMVEINRMLPEEAMTMLEQAVISKESLDDETIRSELLVELDNLPLAITQAAAYVNVNRISISDYVDLVKSTEQNVVEVMSTEIRDNKRYKQAANAVATTWIISFQQIVDRDADAAGLLRFMSCIEWKAIPESILPRIEPEARMTGAVGKLCSYSFLAKRHKEKTYDMHRLVHLAARIWDDRYGYAAKTRQGARLHLSRIFPFGEHEKRDIWRAYLPHAARINKDTAGRDIDGKGELCKRVGYCLQVDGKTKDAVLWVEESYHWLKDLVEDHPDRLASQHVLAMAYRANGQVKEAVELLEQVVVIEARVLAEEHPDRLASQHALALVYWSDGSLEAAKKLLAHVVAMKQKVMSKEHPSRLVSERAQLRLHDEMQI